jgi:hypothetical protein
MSYSNNVVEVDFEEYLKTIDLYNIDVTVDDSRDSVTIQVDYDSIINLLANVDNLNTSKEDIVDVEFFEYPKRGLAITLKENAETYDPSYGEEAKYSDKWWRKGQQAGLSADEVDSLVDDISDLEDDVESLKNFRDHAMKQIEKLNRQVQLLSQPSERVGW